ncbi:hypothetical protein HETIRDRAFT_413567 [Heterobasidion irregulare TC 32-1]|uniref:Phosphatidic acid phosphatase type 2/haloperoxidase domain-containing protein n=1 Tax=Heterobasidion irregulare (strain TC 32-1) TaxID=747525 RepID=W4KN45_HETIT|nr:uncharacterized protein HETIRDRAFT_413567 [Heterobasidion irregulare TC 32-1]ETW87237.1 hypothetical protein HETIRDRAFT_413567 [Heterobasidion irregulare TC 32-1]
MSSRIWRSYALRFLDHTNFTVTSLTAGVVLYSCSAGVAYFSLGAVACSLTVKVLKRVFRQPRPLHPKNKRTYGMPSTHSATITYFGTYIPLACAYLPIHPSFPSSAMSRTVPPLIVIPWAALIAISRIWLGHHTWPQVLCGCAYGFAFAFLWFAIWTHGGSQYGDIAEAHVQSLFG